MRDERSNVWSSRARSARDRPPVRGPAVYLTIEPEVSISELLGRGVGIRRSDALKRTKNTPIERVLCGDVSSIQSQLIEHALKLATQFLGCGM